MKIISIINLKGGVGKTITAINKGHILATVYNKRVLFIDNDKQGNASKFFKLHNYERPSISDLFLRENYVTHKAIHYTQYPELHLISANMTLLNINKQVLMDESRQQETILKKALQQVESEYDYCIIDNAPDINISIINALIASDEVIIPIKIDQFSFEGLEQITEQIEEIKGLNPALHFRGCLVTQYVKNDVNKQGKEYLNSQTKYPIFATHIRRTEKIDESTFAGQPIIDYSARCGAAKDYRSFVKEYLRE